jgi:hypothetical protein
MAAGRLSANALNALPQAATHPKQGYKPTRKPNARIQATSQGFADAVTEPIKHKGILQNTLPPNQLILYFHST